jgi:exopolyphosphatase / guanosine-5'-triphosphate,3'-diphosphate pyrophosphatase
MIDMTAKSAIVDIGSNTIRLVIYQHFKDGRYKEVENVKAVARLRNYLTDEEKLSAEGIEKLLQVLKGIKEILAFHQIGSVRCVATATIRQSVNKEEVLFKVKEESGLDIEILSEEQEAFYGYLAVVSTTPVETGITVDIGGGSTEVTYFKNRKLLESHSYPFGVVSLKQKFIKGDSITEEERLTLTQFLIEQFSALPWLKDRKVPIVGIGGSARNIAQVDQQQRDYEIAGVHQYILTGDTLASIRDQLFPLSYKEIEKIEGLSKDRADIILPAAEVFYQLFQFTDASYYMVSRKGLREGLVIEMAKHGGQEEIDRDSVINLSLKELCHEFGIDDEHSRQMIFLADNIWKQLSRLGCWNLDERDLKMLRYGAYMYYLGEYIDSESSSQHTFYILANRSINGFFHEERIKLASIASFKNKSSFKHYLENFLKWYSKDELKKMREMGSLLKFVYSLNATKRNIVKAIKVSGESDSLSITVSCKGDYLAEKYQAEKQKRHLEKALRTNLVIKFNRVDET